MLVLQLVLVLVVLVVFVLAPVLVVLVLAPVLGCVLMLVLGCANVSACPGHPDLRGCHGVQQARHQAPFVIRSRTLRKNHSAKEAFRLMQKSMKDLGTVADLTQLLMC